MLPAVFLWPAVAGVGGLFVGSSLGGFMQGLVKLALIGGAVYFAFLTVGS